jgi:hypothetical protein
MSITATTVPSSVAPAAARLPLLLALPLPLLLIRSTVRGTRGRLK